MMIGKLSHLITAGIPIRAFWEMLIIRGICIIINRKDVDGEATSRDIFRVDFNYTQTVNLPDVNYTIKYYKDNIR